MTELKISEQPKNATFIQIRGKSQKSLVYPPRPDLTIPDFPLGPLVYSQTWRYDGGILVCGGILSATWTKSLECRIARPENNFAWQWFPQLQNVPNTIEPMGSLLINGVPWLFGGHERTQYFDKGNNVIT